MGIIQDGTGRVSIETNDYPLLSPDTIRKVLSDLTARPWRDPMPPAERAGKTGAVYCSTGAVGSYRADRWRAVDRDLSSSTSWGYRYFDEKPVISSKCYDLSAVQAAVRAQSAENRARAEQFVQLTTTVARLWRGAGQETGNVGRMVGTGSSSSSSSSSERAPRQPQRFSAVRNGKLRQQLQSTPLGARFIRRVEAADFTDELRGVIRERLQAAGQTPDVAEQNAAAVVDEALTAQAETIAAGAGLSPEWQALLDAAYPLASAERYAELLPTLPLEVQNLVKQYAETFQAIGLE